MALAAARQTALRAAEAEAAGVHAREGAEAFVFNFAASARSTSEEAQLAGAMRENVDEDAMALAAARQTALRAAQAEAAGVHAREGAEAVILNFAASAQSTSEEAQLAGAMRENVDEDAMALAAALQTALRAAEAEAAGVHAR